VKRAAACVVLLLLTACGGGSDGEGGGSGARALQVHVRTEPPGAVVPRATTCRFDGDRQYTASGIVKNGGDTTHNVSITVRFLDADGVRVDLASDSVSDLELGESARWDASIYNDDAGAVRSCDVSTKAT
jgi:hypothetical protein